MGDIGKTLGELFGGGGAGTKTKVPGLKKRIAEGERFDPLEEALEEPVPVIPVADDEQKRRARRRSQARQRSSRGRASTIFTQGEGLGG